MVDFFNTNLTNILNTVAPLRERKRTSDKISRERKRLCRAVERKWRKTGLEVYRNIYKKQILSFNCALHSARRAHFSKLITESNNDPRTLFSNINRLLNSIPAGDILDQMSSTRCEEFATFFSDKITSIRATIVINADNSINWPNKNLESLSKFTTISDQELHKLVSESKTSTCCLDPVPSILFKNCFNCMLHSVGKIINMSLETGCFQNLSKLQL